MFQGVMDPICVPTARGTLGCPHTVAPVCELCEGVCVHFFVWNRCCLLIEPQGQSVTFVLSIPQILVT